MGEKVLVLIDGGATHNFVNEKLATAKKMKIEPFSGSDVIVENGNITPCKNVPKMKVSLKDYTIEDDFFIFPLGDSPHVVLGVQWLVSLGDYTTDHATLLFKFKSGGHCEIILQGIKEDKNQNASIKRLEATS